MAIKKLKPKPSAGPDGLSAEFITNVARGVCLPLVSIFCQSFQSSVIPDMWRKAYVTPVFKKGSACDVKNYRPISLTCTCCKVMETFIKEQLLEYLLSAGLISRHQHGFLARHSTCSQLIECTNDWTIALNSRNSVDVAYIDFSKAFDTVSHPKLISKLKSFGIGGKLLAWFSDYLKNRSQVVRVGNCLSTESPVISGVPQGSVLGPILFLLFINDIVDEFGDFLGVKLFADDVKIYVIIKDVVDTDMLQDGLNKLLAWSLKWQLILAENKCQVLHIGGRNPMRSYVVGQSTLPDCFDCVDLGVTVDSDLKFNNHISNIVNKAFQRSSLILRCFKTRDPAVLFRAFVVYVRPILEYCSQVWNPVYIGNIRKIESVQRSFTRRLFGFSKLTYEQRLSALKAESLELRRLKSDLIFLFNVFSDKSVIDSSILPRDTRGICTRGHSLKLVKNHCVSNCRLHSFPVRCINVWNVLPSNIVESSNLAVFKHRLHDYDFSEFCLF